MNKRYKRSDRVGHLLRQELSDLLLRSVKDPRVHGATITEVVVSEDLRHARVYYNTALSGHPPEAVGEGLSRAAGFLRREAGHRLDLKHMPELDFQYDESFDRGARMDGVLHQIEKAGGGEGGGNGQA